MFNYQSSILDELIVDNFAGGGGASTGIELAVGRPVDIAINHDPDAIAMHKVNHPLPRERLGYRPQKNYRRATCRHCVVFSRL